MENLDFYELFRYARVHEAYINYKNSIAGYSDLIPYIEKIEKDTFTQEDFDECIKKGLPNIIKYLKTGEFLVEDNILKALRLDGNLLGYIPGASQTESEIAAAVSQNANALQYARRDLLTDNLLKIALSHNPDTAKVILYNMYTDFVTSSNKETSGNSGDETASLIFDNEPTKDSKNLVNSGDLYTYIQTLISRIETLEQKVIALEGNS